MNEDKPNQSKSRQKYSPQFKDQAVERAARDGVPQVANDADRERKPCVVYSSNMENYFHSACSSTDKTNIHKKIRIIDGCVKGRGHMSTVKVPDYPFTIRHLLKEEGGGYLIEFPDLPGCMSDGETINETILNGKDAVQVWLAAAKELDRPIPKPGELEAQSGKWVQRVPKSIHLRLVDKAREEGVSLNTLVITILAASLGENSYRLQKQHKRKKHA